MANITNIEDFRGGLSLVDSSSLSDNQFEVLKNLYYNKDKRIQTRRGIKNFGDSIGSSPISSYFFWQNDTDGSTEALCTAGTVMYKYDEGTTTWNSIKTGLTEFEADGTTRTRWSFVVYLNIVYMCNGVDAYASRNGTTYTEYGAQPACRYLRYMGDAVYGAGDDANPSTIYATTSGAANAQTLNANDIKVGGDELGRINGMLDLGNILLVFKNKKIYSVAGDLASVSAIDSQNGGYCHRAIKNVENAIMYYSDAGVDRVKARSGVTGASAMASEPLANDLRSLLDQIAAAQRNNNTGWYNTFLNNYYFSFDTGNDSIPDTTLVYSSLVGAWSQYNYPAIYDYGSYIDSDGVESIVVASANGGQMYTIETGFTDFDLAIPTELKTKEWDFGDIGQWKTFDTVDIVGYKNEGAEITIEVFVDGDVVATSVLDDTFIDVTGGSVTIGSRPIGDLSIGGGAGSDTDIDLFPYLIRIPMYSSGPTIQVRMTCETNPNVWTLDRMSISRENETMDFFATANIG